MAGRQWRRDAAKERFWRRMMRRWARSGESIREFCDCESLSEASFYAWRRELRKRDHLSAQASGDERQASLSAESPADAPRFLPVHVVTEAPLDHPPAGSIEVVLTSGTRLRVPAGVDRQTLADLIGVLEQRPC